MPCWRLFCPRDKYVLSRISEVSPKKPSKPPTPKPDPPKPDPTETQNGNRKSKPPAPAPPSIKPDTEKDNEETKTETPPPQDSSDNEIAEKKVSVEELEVARRSGVVPTTVVISESSVQEYPKEKKDEELIKSALDKNEFLQKLLTGKRLDDVVKAMYRKEFEPNQVLMKMGDKGDKMYVSAEGKYNIKGKGFDTVVEDVRVFGELAILYNAKRMATIKALTKGVTWVLEGSVYQQIMLQSNIKEEDEMLEFLKNVKTLNGAGDEVLQRVTTLLKVKFFQSGEEIVKQGDKGDKFYIIRAGHVVVSKEGEGIKGKLGRGEYFGELALLSEERRQATVKAEAPGVECLTLNRKQFETCFGNIKDISNIIEPEPVQEAVEEYTEYELTDFKIKKTLGVGGFGRVELVQCKKDKSLVFALKYLKKCEIVEQNQQDHVYNEKNLQMACNSKFIVRLHRTYKDVKYIYFLMEVCLGGDLFNALQKQKKFEEKEARFIAGCVLEAFEYLHTRSIVYRDLKPENLMIDKTGYIKLTDFGFAKKLDKRGKTYTFAGTPEYVAPEIVLNKGHDRAVDYWAYGVFIFELFTGRTPFYTKDPSHMDTYNKILKGIDQVDFPQSVPNKARNIIEKLVRPLATDRLGMQKNKINDIKTHKWFMGFDWDKLKNGQMPTSLKPKIKDQLDTRNFDVFKEDSYIPEDEESGWDKNF